MRLLLLTLLASVIPACAAAVSPESDAVAASDAARSDAQPDGASTSDGAPCPYPWRLGSNGRCECPTLTCSASQYCCAHPDSYTLLFDCRDTNTPRQLEVCSHL